MKNTLQGMAGAAFTILGASPAFANEPSADYAGISFFYYALIGIVLAYGAWDIFFKKD